eukprot:Phypoly_transcript_13792.p1 GENE.Phypoly_transcript_13792~~Phypoly_transcript_13792.p1  ORF type:complete len:211 (+),score=36.50 Phypoly_transcript_13792:328-960(+)
MGDTHISSSSSSSSSSEEPYLIVVVGNSSVGKTTLILKFFDKAFNVDDARDQTLNVDYKTVDRVYDGTPVKIQVWDTVGDKYKGSTSFIVKKPSVGAYILAFDLGNPESLEDIFKTWEGKLPDDKVRILVGTHADEPQVVTDEMIKEKLHLCGSQYSTTPKYFKVSSKTGENLEEMFEAIMKVLMKKKRNKSGITLDSSTPAKKSWLSKC